jgi:hypothetical protein
MVEAYQSNYFPLSYMFSPRYGEARTTVPVLKSQAPYANFRYVAGVPAQAGSAAYSIDKLHILNVLISRLENARTQPLAASEVPKGTSSAKIDAMINKYSAEVRRIVTAPALPYAPDLGVQPGMLFSLAA